MQHNPTSTTHLSRLLATVASQEPPNPERPAILYREGTPANARPYKALHRSPFRDCLQGERMPDGRIYFWRKRGTRPPFPADTPAEMLRTAHRPYTGGELLNPELVSWHPIPVPPLLQDDPNAKLAWLSANPGATVLLRPSCTSSLRTYYSRRTPEFSYVYRDGNLYATNPAPATEPPADPLPPFYCPDGPPPQPVRSRPPRDVPDPDAWNVYLNRTATARSLADAFPRTGVMLDINGSQHDRYIQIPINHPPTHPQILFLANYAVLCTGRSAGPPAFLSDVHAHQFYRTPYRQETSADNGA